MWVLVEVEQLVLVLQRQVLNRQSEMLFLLLAVRQVVFMMVKQMCIQVVRQVVVQTTLL
jgi:hypothetical protein